MCNIRLVITEDNAFRQQIDQIIVGAVATVGGAAKEQHRARLTTNRELTSTPVIGGIEVARDISPGEAGVTGVGQDKVVPLDGESEFAGVGVLEVIGHQAEVVRRKVRHAACCSGDGERVVGVLIEVGQTGGAAVQGREIDHKRVQGRCTVGEHAVDFQPIITATGRIVGVVQIPDQLTSAHPDIGTVDRQGPRRPADRLRAAGPNHDAALTAGHRDGSCTRERGVAADQ